MPAKFIKNSFICRQRKPFGKDTKEHIHIAMHALQLSYFLVSCHVLHAKVKAMKRSTPWTNKPMEKNNI